MTLFVTSPLKTRMTKLAVFDFDSTLMDGECIDIVLKEVVQDSQSIQNLEALRAKGMRGEVDLQQSLEQRISHFRGLSLDRLEAICQTLPWMLNAKTTIAELKQRGYFTLCLSGAFRTATRRVLSDLRMDAYCCNTLESKNGILTGVINGNLMHHHSKGEMLAMIQAELNISKKNTIAIGDGANDLSLFAYAEKKVAFCAQAILIEKANCVIENKDLSEILPFAD